MLNVLIDGPKDSPYVFIFAHGAGADMHHEFMLFVANALADAEICVIRFNFPYSAKKREDGIKRFPDKLPVLLDSFKEVIDLYGKKKMVIGGKSMGGWVASHLESHEWVKGVACLGFPFHPLKKPDKNKGEHLRDMLKPTLILQGERDPFGSKSELMNYPVSRAVEFLFLPDGDHGFKPRKISGHTEKENRACVCRALIEFIKKD